MKKLLCMAILGMLAWAMLLKAAPAKQYSKEENTRAPLPEILLTAKSVYIRSENSDMADKAYEVIKMWGKYKVVTSVKDADIIFDFSTDSKPVRIKEGGHFVFSDTIHLRLLDARSGEELWGDSSGKRHSTQHLVFNLWQWVDMQAVSTSQ